MILTPPLFQDRLLAPIWTESNAFSGINRRLIGLQHFHNELAETFDLTPFLFFFCRYTIVRNRSSPLVTSLIHVNILPLAISGLAYRFSRQRNNVVRPLALPCRRLRTSSNGPLKNYAVGIVEDFTGDVSHTLAHETAHV